MTRIEFDILHFLMENRGHVLSSEQIYNHIWKDERAESIEEAVKSAVKRIRKKIGGHDTDFIENVWGVGYRLPEVFD